MKPSRSILYWGKGEYVPSHATNVAATFARIRRERAQQQAREQDEREDARRRAFLSEPNVKQLRRTRA